MGARIAKTYTENLQDFAARYREAGETWPATARQIARWAYREKLWRPQEQGVINLLARDIARALREEHYTDPQGRHVRTKHAARRRESDELGEEGQAKGQQKVFWADIRVDKFEYIELALKQRRMQIVGDCKQLKTDMDSCNDNHPEGKKIQIIFNFIDDLAEMDQPTDYRPSSPEV